MNWGKVIMCKDSIQLEIIQKWLITKKGVRPFSFLQNSGRQTFVCFFLLVLNVLLSFLFVSLEINRPKQTISETVTAMKQKSDIISNILVFRLFIPSWYFCRLRLRNNNLKFIYCLN